MIGRSIPRNRSDAWDMMGSSVSRASRASNRVESACTHNPLEQQARHLPLGDQLHRLPGARPMRCDAGPRCGLFYKRCHLRAIAFTTRSTPPRYPSSQLSCCGRRGGHLPVCATHETKGPTAPVFRALRTPSHASKQAPLLSSIARVLQRLAPLRAHQSQPACTHRTWKRGLSRRLLRRIM